jgi:hypothetical protein
MIAFADDNQRRSPRAQSGQAIGSSGTRSLKAFYRDPAGLAVLLAAATTRRRRLLGDPAARPGTSFRPDPPDLMTLREVGTYLSSKLRGELPAELHSQLKFRLAQMFQMIDELELADSSTGETGAGCAW